ncbi:MAG TPA: hypothetical protein VMS98_14310 [Thermoanaerobaculia bacterium]|nr:hypothetical protein [Thermoanaerobaculia bacterium]
MREVYRKRGRSVRWEHGHLITVTESGQAIEEGQVFSAKPLRDAPPGMAAPHQAGEGVESVVDQIQTVVRSPLSIERLVVSEGSADHELGGMFWTETTRRVHLSMTFQRYRALIDLGDFEIDEIERVAGVLPRVSGERAAPDRVVLESAVTAALVPHLIGIAPPNVTLLQTAGGLDGKGRVIEESVLRGPPFPNWYRPSYRVRPQLVPLNVRARCSVTGIEPSLARAVALLAPPHGLSLRVLVVEGSDVYAATVHVDRIDAIAPPGRWYPYAAGSFGALMTVV